MYCIYSERIFVIVEKMLNIIAPAGDQTRAAGSDIKHSTKPSCTARLYMYVLIYFAPLGLHVLSPSLYPP